MNAPVLVTGGTGRLGRRVVRRLNQAGCDVRVLTRQARPMQRTPRSSPTRLGYDATCVFRKSGSKPTSSCRCSPRIEATWPPIAPRRQPFARTLGRHFSCAGKGFGLHQPRTAGADQRFPDPHAIRAAGAAELERWLRTRNVRGADTLAAAVTTAVAPSASASAVTMSRQSS